jgi:hypothetical protein
VNASRWITSWRFVQVFCQKRSRQHLGDEWSEEFRAQFACSSLGIPAKNCLSGERPKSELPLQALRKSNLVFPIGDWIAHQMPILPEGNHASGPPPNRGRQKANAKEYSGGSCLGDYRIHSARVLSNRHSARSRGDFFWLETVHNQELRQLSKSPSSDKYEDVRFLPGFTD